MAWFNYEILDEEEYHSNYFIRVCSIKVVQNNDNEEMVSGLQWSDGTFKTFSNSTLSKWCKASIYQSVYNTKKRIPSLVSN